MKSFQSDQPSTSEIAQIHAKLTSSEEENFEIWSESHAVGGETWESGTVLNIFLLASPS
jgi:hypothetical protein